MTSLSEIIRSFDPNGEFTAPPGWLQGRTVYGGLTAALALQAVLATSDEPLPPLKSAMVSFVAPVAGPMRFSVRLMRQGKSATSIAVDCLSGPELCLRAEFFFAAPRPSLVDHNYCPRPDVAGPDDYAPLQHGGRAPASVGNFDLRPVGDALPMSGAPYPELTAWLRHKDAAGVHPAVSLMAVADGLPPAAIATVSSPVPFSSMTWMLDFPTAAEAHVWHLLRSTSQCARDGYSFQSMRVWSESGDLILSGAQSVAIFG